VQTGAGDIAQVLLLRAVVLARSGYAQSESVAIEGQALRGVGYDDRRVVDAEEKPITGLALARRELQEFQRMAGAGRQTRSGPPTG
jgi:hypothetical protein